MLKRILSWISSGSDTKDMQSVQSVQSVQSILSELPLHEKIQRLETVNSSKTLYEEELYGLRAFSEKIERLYKDSNNSYQRRALRRKLDEIQYELDTLAHKFKLIHIEADILEYEIAMEENMF